jgi:hypothetical protein
MLEGGRNSLLESAQGATLTSVATAGLPRQCNRFATTARARRQRAKAGWFEWTYGRSRLAKQRRGSEEIDSPAHSAEN